MFWQSLRTEQPIEVVDDVVTVVVVVIVLEVVNSLGQKTPMTRGNHLVTSELCTSKTQSAQG